MSQKSWRSADRRLWGDRHPRQETGFLDRMTNQKFRVKIGLSELSTMMSNYTITLSEKTYYALLEVVEKQGLTPEAWIIAQLPKPQTDKHPLSDNIEDLIGAIESSPWQVMFDALQEFPEDLQIERDRLLPMEREPMK